MNEEELLKTRVEVRKYLSDSYMLNVIIDVIDNNIGLLREYKQLEQENQQLKEEVKGYQQMYFDKVMIVNKALEYIEKEWCWDGTGIDNLEDILIGGNNEDRK